MSSEKAISLCYDLINKLANSIRLNEQDFLRRVIELSSNFFTSFVLEPHWKDVLDTEALVIPYEYVDIFSMSPRKPWLFPPWINLPHKIVAGNELVVHRAILVINPLPGPSGTPTGRHVLGSRPFRIRFSLLNVTTATAGPN